MLKEELKPVTKNMFRSMQDENLEKKSSSFTLGAKMRDYKLLVKFALTTMVVFSAVVSYLLAPKVVAYNTWMIILLFSGDSW